MITTLTRNNVAAPIRGEADKTEIQRANRKYEYVRIARLLNEAASIENYMMLLKCFQDLDLEGDIAINKRITKWVINENKTVDLCPNIAKAIFEATSVDWGEGTEDKDYLLAVREWIKIG